MKCLSPRSRKRTRARKLSSEKFHQSLEEIPVIQDVEPQEDDVESGEVSRKLLERPREA
jgi:hypothetical protein